MNHRLIHAAPSVPVLYIRYIRSRALPLTTAALTGIVLVAAWAAHWLETRPYFDHTARIPVVVLAPLLASAAIGTRLTAYVIGATLLAVRGARPQSTWLSAARARKARNPGRCAPPGARNSRPSHAPGRATVHAPPGGSDGAGGSGNPLAFGRVERPGWR
ncbi:hypothetical protein [Streptomyces atratus]|uniref:hypothetical protein n=1 Tax=Streptomyces atratus TaxID=1893 RepID=UPI00225BE706|nr:hypothetical protein [Streptomyces atratus]MCX5340909.1 hypothetical protein [Streptomyces atratus]